jgi:YD repeat-containing protein
MPTEKRVYAGTGSGTLMAKTGFYYDDTSTGFLVSQGSSIPQFDAVNYGTGFTYRGNLTKTRRYEMGTSSYTENKAGYNTTGSLILTRDALNHDNVIAYADRFADTIDRNSYAYPTTVTDPDGHYSTIAYDYNTAAKVAVHGPALSAGTPVIAGAEVYYEYDSIGRPSLTINVSNSAKTVYYYAASGTNATTFSTIKDLSSDTVASTNTDGLGRPIAVSTEHPGSTGGYKAMVTKYDVMGRVSATSNPTEISGSFLPYGDDSAGWLYTMQTYDWKGRPLVTTNQDGTTKIASYGGCGCAGGEVVTIQDEGTLIGGTPTRRQYKSYSDVLGRVVKTQTFAWDGITPYQTNTTTYNVLDQATLVRQYDGDISSSTFQDSTMEYDGYGRLYRSHAPQQLTEGTSTNTFNYTTFTYNADDTKHVVADGRGATATFSHNSRRLVTRIDYGAPGGSGITVPSSVEFGYDGAGNRTSMTDGLGTVTYVYDSLSQMTDETRDFSDTLSN